MNNTYTKRRGDVLYCSYCGEKIEEEFVIIQHEYNNVEIRHPECKEL